MAKILLVDDDAAFRRTLARVLEDCGFAVSQANSGASGMAKALEERPDLMILDLVMPGPQGTDVCLTIKQAPETAGIPILMLTGNDKEGMEIACLDMGADDYLTKPVRSERLLAHCRALMRRAGSDARGMGTSGLLSLGALRLDYERKLVSLENIEHNNLTPKEFDLLYVLARRSPMPRTREELYHEVWGSDPPSEISLRTVEVHIRRIRIKLGWKTGQWLEGVSGRGYCLQTPG